MTSDVKVSKLSTTPCLDEELNEIRKAERRAARAAAKLEREEREAKLKAEIAAAARDKFIEDTKTWKDRLIAVMSDYANLPGFKIASKAEYVARGFKVTKDNAARVGPVVFLGLVRVEDDNDANMFMLPIDPENYHDLTEMDNAEYEVKKYHERVAEEKRLNEIRITALAKLSDEEKIALNLPYKLKW